MSEQLEVLYFGAKDQPGHFLHSKRRYSMQCEMTPWGYALDSGLLVPKEKYYSCDSTPDGKWKEAHKDGWTAVAFWDRSCDSRPGCNSVFLAAASMTGEELLALARQQWPEIFSRPNFPIK